jgi:hypothetical protein
MGKPTRLSLLLDSQCGAIWSTPVKLTTETAHVRRVQAVVSGSTLYLFFSRSDTTGALLYQTTTDHPCLSLNHRTGAGSGVSWRRRMIGMVRGEH